MATENKNIGEAVQVKYPIKKNCFNGYSLWFVPSREHATSFGWGDSVHRSQIDAQKQVSMNFKLDAQDISRKTAKIAMENKEKTLRLERVDTDGFADSFDPLRRGRIIKTLSTLVCHNEVISTLKALLKDLVPKGWTVKIVGRKRILESKEKTYLGTKEITKTGLDFAEYLLNLNNPQPWAMTQKVWDAHTRFYRSGKSKCAQIPTGEKIILTQKSTEKTFLDQSRRFLGIIRKNTIASAISRGKDVPMEVLKEYETLKNLT